MAHLGFGDPLCPSPVSAEPGRGATLDGEPMEEWQHQLRHQPKLWLSGW